MQSILSSLSRNDGNKPKGLVTSNGAGICSATSIAPLALGICLAPEIADQVLQVRRLVWLVTMASEFLGLICHKQSH